MTGPPRPDVTRLPERARAGDEPGLGEPIARAWLGNELGGEGVG